MTSRGQKYWESGAIPLIAPEILGDIITQVADVAFVIDDGGHVLSVLLNPNFDAGQHLSGLEGKDLRTGLTVESIPKFDERLNTFLEHGGLQRPLELNHADSRFRTDLPVRYSFHRVGADGAILVLGRDLRPVAEMQQQLIRAQLALEKDYETQREFETRFRVLMESTPDSVVLVSLHSGRITDANNCAADRIGLSRHDLVGRDFDATFADASGKSILEHLGTQAALRDGEPVTARLRRGGDELQIVPTLFRAAGDRLVLCRIGSSDDPAAAPKDRQSRLMKEFFAESPDAIVFTDDAGLVVSVNDGFLNLLGSADDLSVRGRSLAEFLQRGSVDLKVMTENAARAGRMRLYATRVAGDYGSPRSVEIAVTAIEAGQERIFGFVLREVNRGDPARGVEADDANMQSVVELVGSASLREIVAETTNVVERMCIETAIELTMNNRVAAAEMLGLSRQSLYVKLRKFGILSKDGSD